MDLWRHRLRIARDGNIALNTAWTGVLHPGWKPGSLRFERYVPVKPPLFLAPSFGRRGSSLASEKRLTAAAAMAPADSIALDLPPRGPDEPGSAPNGGLAYWNRNSTCSARSGGGLADARGRKIRVRLAVRLDDLDKGRKLAEASVAATLGIPPVQRRRTAQLQTQSFQFGTLAALRWPVRRRRSDHQLLKLGKSPGRPDPGAGCRMNRATKMHSFGPRSWAH